MLSNTVARDEFSPDTGVTGAIAPELLVNITVLAIKKPLLRAAKVHNANLSGVSATEHDKGK